MTNGLLDTPLEQAVEDVQSQEVAQEEVKTESTSSNIDWRDLLPDELKNDKSLMPFKEVGALAKSYKELSSKLGKEHVVKPSKNAGQYEWDRFYNELGRPEASDKYELKLPVEEDKKIPENDVKYLKELSYKLALDNDRAQNLLDSFLERRGNTHQEIEHQKEQEFAQMKSEAENYMKNKYGAKYNDTLAQANLAVKKLGGDNLLTTLDKTGLKYNTDIIELFVNIAKATSDSEIPEAATKALRSKEDAIRQKQEMAGDLKSPLYDNTHAEHAAYLKRYSDLLIEINS